MPVSVKKAPSGGKKAPLVQRAAEPCAVLLEMATPALYAMHPFRRTGLPALATVRDVSKRADQLKLSAELDAPVFYWSFAPEPALKLDQIREATQVLKDPRVRLVYELFWFWPHSYPSDVPDHGIESLGRGDTDGAWDFWRKAAEGGDPIAVHNLAIFYHLQALDLEQSPSPPETQLRFYWRQALTYWEQMLSLETVWVRLQDRIVEMGDAQVPVEFAHQLRETLPGALAKINTNLALKHAEGGWARQAALNASMVGLVRRSDGIVRRAMESCVLPILRRVDRRVLDLRNVLAKNTAKGLLASAQLLRLCDDDLRLVETLRHGAEGLFAEVSNTVVSAALDGVVDYQRVTLDNAGCLILLRRLARMEMLPESRQRLRDTTAVIQRNAEEEGQAVVWLNKLESVAKAAETQPAAAFVRVTEELIPEWRLLSLSEVARQEYACELVVLVRRLAEVVWADRAQKDWLAKVLTTARQLPAAPEVLALVEGDWSLLQAEMQTQQEKSLRLEFANDVIEIDAQGIAHNGRRVAPDALTGLRHGLCLVGEGADEVAHYLIGWRSAEVEIVLDCNVLFGEEAAEAGYENLLGSFYYFLTTNLISRIVFSIRSGQTVFLGATPLNKHGMQFTADAFLWKKETWVPYDHLQQSITDYRLTVVNLDNPQARQVYPLGTVWNAAIMGHVIDALAVEPA